MWVFMPAPHISGFAPQTPTNGRGVTDSRPVSRETGFWCIPTCAVSRMIVAFTAKDQK
jgi:hypothetical protein